MNDLDAILAEDLTKPEAFRELRQKMDLTQHQLAKLLSISIPTLSRMELGKNRIHMRTAMAMKMLYVAYKRFTDGMPQKPSSNDVYKMLFGVFHMNTQSVIPSTASSESASSDEQTPVAQPYEPDPDKENAAPQPA